MEIIVNVPAQRLGFALEVLRSLAFVKSARPKAKAKPAPMDTTKYLQASPANAERLQQAYEQFDPAARIDFALPAE